MMSQRSLCSSQHMGTEIRRGREGEEGASSHAIHSLYAVCIMSVCEGLSKKPLRATMMSQRSLCSSQHMGIEIRRWRDRRVLQVM